MKIQSSTMLALILLALSGCDPTVHGNGVFGEDTRSVPAFDGVSIGLGIVATVRAGATARSVTISGDQNVLQYIDTNVVDGVLTTALSGVDSFDSVHQVQLVIATPELVMVDAWGGGEGGADIDVTAIDAASFTVSAREGSSVKIAAVDATVRTNLSVSASGASTIDATGYPVAAATATLSAANAEVTVTGTVGGALSGGSTLTIHGGGVCTFTPAPGTACVLEP